MKKNLFILITILFFTNYTNAQCDYADDSDVPKELFRKRLKDKEAGFRYGNPYTMFVHTVDFNLATTLNKIRNNIIKGQPFADLNNVQNDYAKLYKDLWVNANYVEPGKCGYDSHCTHPQWVKSNAIVYLIGIGYKEISGKKT